MGKPEKVVRKYFDWQYAQKAESLSGSYDEYFDERMGYVSEDSDTVLVHPDPEVWDKFAFKVVKRRKHAVNFKNLPTPTLTIEDGHTEDKYYVYSLETPIPRNVEPKRKPDGTKTTDARNCYRMVRHSLSVAHGLEPVEEVPVPDGVVVLSQAVLELPDENGELQPEDIEWTATNLLQWQRQHGYTDEMDAEMRAKGGNADSPKQRQQREQLSAAGVQSRQRKGNLKAMRAEAMDALIPEERNIRHQKIATELGMAPDTVRKVLKKAADLTPEQRTEALEWATSAGEDITPIMEHQAPVPPSEPVTDDIPETTISELPVESTNTSENPVPTTESTEQEPSTPPRSTPQEVAPVNPVPVMEEVEDLPEDNPPVEEEVPNKESEVVPVMDVRRSDCLKNIVHAIHEYCDGKPQMVISAMKDDFKQITLARVKSVLKTPPPKMTDELWDYLRNSEELSGYAEFVEDYKGTSQDKKQTSSRKRAQSTQSDPPADIPLGDLFMQLDEEEECHEPG